MLQGFASRKAQGDSMKKVLAVLASSLLAFGCSSETTDIEVVKKLGEKDFNKVQWQESDAVERGKMLYSYLKQREPISNLTRAQIEEELGPATGYYDYDEFPAYYVGPKPDGVKQPAYLVAFITDHQTGKVKGIHIEPSLKL